MADYQYEPTVRVMWRIKGTDKWMTRDEMLCMYPYISEIPRKINGMYRHTGESSQLAAVQCECFTTSRRQPCKKRAKFRYTDLYGNCKAMCMDHMGSQGPYSSMEEEARLMDWYDSMPFERNDQAELEAAWAKYREMGLMK